MRYKKHLLTALVFLSFLVPAGTSLHAQNLNTDSLLNVVANPDAIAAGKINSLNILSELYSKDSTQKAMQFANEAYQLSLQEKNKLFEARSLRNLAGTYLYNDNYDVSLKYAFRALDLSLQEKSKPDIESSYTLLGWIFFDSRNYDFSMQYHRRAYDLLLEMGDKKKYGTTANALGLIYMARHNYDSAGFYFDKALSLARENGNFSGEAAALNNLGVCENFRGRYQQAIIFFNQSLGTKGAKDNVLLQAEIFNQLAEANIKLENYSVADSALIKAKKLIDSSTSNEKKEKLLDYLFNYSQLYNAQKRYSEAYFYLQEHNRVKEEIVSANKSEAIAVMKLKRETEENEAEMKVLEAQKELRVFQRNALATGIILVVIIGILILTRINHQRKKENELAAVKQQLMQKELDNIHLEKDALNNKLAYKNAELKNSALFISQRNDLVREFIDELSAWQAEMPREYGAKFTRVLSKFQHSLELNQDAQELSQVIAESNRDFFYNLLAKYPDLTENEKKLCAQIRLNLSIKDISSLNNISVKSVEMARYRLRKHFDLNYEDSLNDFLKQF